MLTNHNKTHIYEQKIQNGSRERKYYQKKLDLVIIRFSGNTTYPTLYQKFMFSLARFSARITYTKLTIETLGQGVKYVKS